MTEIFCTLVLDKEKGGKFYELGYFIGSNLFYILLVLVLIIAAIYVFKAFRKNRFR
ncbi:hypothetical protein SAMN02745246_00192 [Leeuwenhoekiella marinoflava DSM 3653]|uniref:Uncharacterized protein n=2 Tax=Leeuwenhoekiella marinoflava TaxID=988 RepID=A0A4Q0PQX7_9FLAO|nr:hypothetical protein DSL99_133 [Leeuwenhoekiella marinoflava]SHE36401.1 hypothetical protein SAMN02745246_00192 [Leeuwenhoekiella marinoflava DSM 3653]